MVLIHILRFFSIFQVLPEVDNSSYFGTSSRPSLTPPRKTRALNGQYPTKTRTPEAPLPGSPAIVSPSRRLSTNPRKGVPLWNPFYYRDTDLLPSGRGAQKLAPGNCFFIITYCISSCRAL